VRLRRPHGHHRLYLALSQEFHIARDSRFPGEWKVVTDAYAYSLSLTEDLSEEFILWHWHPASGAMLPHLHLVVKHPRLGGLRKLHVPSGRVSIEEVIGLLIRELSVQAARDDWAEVLADTEARFRHYRTWG
jgi:hypothetical protein